MKISVTPQPLHPRGKGRVFPSSSKLGGTQSRSRILGGEKIVFLCRESNHDSPIVQTCIHYIFSALPFQILLTEIHKFIQFAFWGNTSSGLLLEKYLEGFVVANSYNYSVTGFVLYCCCHYRNSAKWRMAVICDWDRMFVCIEVGLCTRPWSPSTKMHWTLTHMKLHDAICVNDLWTVILTQLQFFFMKRIN
jgi:hypothetical protein